VLVHLGVKNQQAGPMNKVEDVYRAHRLAHGALSKAGALLGASNLSTEALPQATAAAAAAANPAYSCLAYDELQCECGPDGRLLGSASAYVLKWSKVAIKKTANAYLSSPVLLALMPLLVGCFIGFVFAWWWVGGGSCKNEEKKEKQSENICYAGRLQCHRITDIRSTLFLLSTGITAILASCSHVIVPMLIKIIACFPMKYVFAGDRNESMVGNSGGGGGTELSRREDAARQHLSSEANTTRDSGVPLSSVPKHIAVIMDGNRRYGRKRYGSATRGHWDGSKTLADFAKWCMAEGVQVLTVYAFSTENWDRDPDEIAALMAIFVRYCDELRQEALTRSIRLRVLSSETARIPEDVAAGLKRMVDETAHCDKFLMNICLSYGSRGEIVNACRSVASDVRRGTLDVQDVSEAVVAERLLTGGCPDPDIVMRTSGEMRISNFLLWQMAYSEMFFVDKTWPEITKEDLVGVIQNFAGGRKRRFGK